ncbi:hypothetical protein ACNKHK_16195 [Shigella flexneri]
MYNSGRDQLTDDLLSNWSKGDVRQQRAARYGRALQAMEAGEYDEARKAPQACWLQPRAVPGFDLATDIDPARRKPVMPLTA